MLLDQRHMLGVSTLDDVPARWAEVMAAVNRGREARGLHPLRLHHVKKPVPAFVNHGRWVARCSATDCGGGIACSPENKHGACLDCGRIYPITFPAKATMTKAAALLDQRPDGQRNWHPHEGETLKRLQVENELLLGRR